MQVKSATVWLSGATEPAKFDPVSERWVFPDSQPLMKWCEEVNQVAQVAGTALDANPWQMKFMRGLFNVHVALWDEPVSWKEDSMEKGLCYLFLLPWLPRWWDGKAAGSVVVRMIPWMLQDLYPEGHPTVPEVEVVKRPLLSITGAPRSGSRRYWHKSRPVDAFAKAVRAVGDLGSGIVQRAAMPSAWPDLELQPVITSSSALEMSQDNRVCRVPVPPGFPKATKLERGEYALRMVCEALRLRGKCEGFDADGVVNELQDAAQEYQFTSSLGAPVAVPNDEGNMWLRPEFVLDPGGGRIRAVVTSAQGRTQSSEWQPAGPSLRMLQWAWAPYNDYEWRGHDVWVTTEIGGRRGFTFSPQHD